MGLVWAWMGLTVGYNYSGNWTGLFCSGELLPPPAGLAHENIVLFPNSVGYDGQAYHYLAHDPFFKRGYAASMDMPRVRTRRPLISLLAWAVSFGDDSRIDASLIGVVIAFTGLGVYWLARLALTYGFSSWFGLAFLLTPPVLVSIDRILTDGALAAFCIGFVLYWRERNFPALWVLCVLAALTRETGAALAGAMCFFFILRRFAPTFTTPLPTELAGDSGSGQRKDDWKLGVLFAAALLPTMLWAWFCARHTPPDASGWIGPIPFQGLITRLVTPLHYKVPGWIESILITLDYAGLLGIVLALWAIARKAVARIADPPAIALYLYALLAIFLKSYDAWAEVYAFGRTLGPILILLALDGFQRRSIRPAASAGLMLPRIFLQYAPQLLGVARGLAGG